MLKTFFRPLLGLVLLVFIGAPVIGQDGSRDVNLLSPAERQWLKEHPVIRHAPDPDYAPLEFFFWGRHVGASCVLGPGNVVFRAVVDE